MRSFLTAIFPLVPLLVATPAFGEVGLEIFPDGPSEMNSVVLENPPIAGFSRGLQINLSLDCYATNLRGVANPLSPSATVKVRVNFEDQPTVGIQFPARLFFNDPTLEFNFDPPPPGVTDPPYKLTDSGGTLSYVPNPPLGSRWSMRYLPADRLLIIQTDILVGDITVTPSGDFDLEDTPTQITSVDFRQEGLTMSGTYTGENGVLSGYYRASVSSSGQVVNLRASFPGAAHPGQIAVVSGGGYTGFCGAYYSPLMVFFSEDRPRFSGVSEFPVHPGYQGPVSWVEPKSPGYFLALDGDNDGKITSHTELFGSASFANGFEALRELDANKDGTIDERDPQFRRLTLWKDSNGNGQTDPGELAPLSSQGITSFSLNYDAELVAQPGRAEMREFAPFTFTRKGKKLTGRVIDVWLAPRRQLAQTVPAYGPGF